MAMELLSPLQRLERFERVIFLEPILQWIIGRYREIWWERLKL